MQWENDLSRYGVVAQLLHWAVVVLVVAQFVLASIAEDLALGSAKIGVLAQHKSIGVTILVLTLLRLLWRRPNPVPTIPTTVHRWLMSSARNFPVSWFGVFTLPDLIAPSRSAYELLQGAHEAMAKTLLVVALVHLSAALKHHFVDGDNVLRRMLPVKLK